MDNARIPPTNHPVRHDLKTRPKPFASSLSGFKKHEIRVNDRDFREGDELCLREWNPRYADRLRRMGLTQLAPERVVRRHTRQAIVGRCEKRGDRAHKRGSKFDPFRITRAKDANSTSLCGSR